MDRKLQNELRQLVQLGPQGDGQERVGLPVRHVLREGQGCGTAGLVGAQVPGHGVEVVQKLVFVPVGVALWNERREADGQKTSKRAAGRVPCSGPGT